VVKTNADFVIQNAFLAVANRSMNQMAQIESKCGLAPRLKSQVNEDFALTEKV